MESFISYVLDSMFLSVENDLEGKLEIKALMMELGILPTSRTPILTLLNVSLEDAKRLFEMANNSNLLELQRYLKEHPPHALTIALLISAAAKSGVTSYHSEQARKRASRPRYPEYKREARELWDQWQQNQKIYKNQTQYCQALMDKFGISTNTARQWVKDFKAEDLYKQEQAATGKLRKFFKLINQ